MASIVSLPADDPERIAAARPWRQRVWESIPGWARIGLTAGVVMVVVLAVLGIRIAFGLLDPPEVTRIRGAVAYRDQLHSTAAMFLPRMIKSGLLGRTACDVAHLHLGMYREITDEDLDYVAQNFPNLEILRIAGGTFTTKGLLALKNCVHLRHIDVTDTRVDDGIVELLPALPKLRVLYLDFCDVGDEFAASAVKYPLERCSVNGTRVSTEALAAWQQAQPKCVFVKLKDTEALRGVICWEDGIRSHSHVGQASIMISGPRDPISPPKWPQQSTVERWGWTSQDSIWSTKEIQSRGDGEYQAIMTLRLRATSAAPAETMTSVPVEFVVKDGTAAPKELEFRIPAKRGETYKRILY